MQLNSSCQDVGFFCPFVVIDPTDLGETIEKTWGFTSQFIKATKVLMATPLGRHLEYHTPEQVSNQGPPDSRPGVLTTTLLGDVWTLIATAHTRRFHEEWISNCENWLLSIGIRPSLIERDVHAKEKLVRRRGGGNRQ